MGEVVLKFTIIGKTPFWFGTNSIVFLLFSKKSIFLIYNIEVKK